MKLLTPKMVREEEIMRRVLVLMLLLVVAVPHVMAQEKGPAAPAKAKTSYQMPTVVVTDTKISQPQERVTQKIEVIPSEDFDKLPNNNRNLSELLQYQPGLFVTPLSRNDANWGSFGGLGPKYNVYYLDGLPIDSFADGMSLDPWAFQRVELYKGPASVMYPNYLTQDFAGNETPLAGMTNFILKDKIDTSATRMLFGFGSWRTLNGRVYNQGRVGDFNYFFGANLEQSNYTNYGTTNSWLAMNKDPEYQKSRFYVKGAYLFDGREDNKLSVFAHHTQQTGDAGRPNRDYNHNYDTINAVYANQISEAWNLQVKGGFRNYDRRWAEDNYPTNLQLREHDGVQQQVFPADIALNYKHFGNSVLTVGADFQAATYKTYAEVNGSRSTVNDITAYQTGAYLQEKVVLDKWVLRAGGRFNYTSYDYDLLSGATPGMQNQTWTNPLWSAGVRYNALQELAVYANAGSSYVVPSAKSVGGTLPASAQGVPGRNGQLPNPGLQAESGIGADAGIDVKPIQNMTFGVRGFWNKVDNAIVENVVSQNPSQSMSVNAGKAESYGVEVAVDQYLTPRLYWFANLTYTYTNIQNSIDPDQDGSNVPFVPNYIGNLGLTLRLPYDVLIIPYLQAVGTFYDSTSKSSRRQYGPYEVINLVLQKAWVKKAEYTVSTNVYLNNVTNRQYEMPWQFQDPGFNWLVNVELSF
jgi:iron complex outermembrane recepter protein